MTVTNTRTNFKKLATVFEVVYSYFGFDGKRHYGISHVRGLNEEDAKTTLDGILFRKHATEYKESLDTYCIYAIKAF